MGQRFSRLIKKIFLHKLYNESILHISLYPEVGKIRLDIERKKPYNVV